MDETVATVEEQAEMVNEFLEGLLVAFAVGGEVRSSPDRRRDHRAAVEGDDLACSSAPRDRR